MGLTNFMCSVGSLLSCLLGSVYNIVRKYGESESFRVCFMLL